MKNPFLQSIRLKSFTRSQTLPVIDTSDNVSIKGSFSFTKQFEVDHYIKLYTNGNLSNVFSQISDTACKLFLYISYNVAKETDIIKLDPVSVMSFVGIKSDTTYYKYIQELIDNAVIARKNNREYWINPVFIFNGDRLKFYQATCPECIEEIQISSDTISIKKKKDLMKQHGCSSYYELKKLLGKEQIETLLSKSNER